jgi:hypothetical protein
MRSQGVPTPSTVGPTPTTWVPTPSPQQHSDLIDMSQSIGPPSIPNHFPHHSTGSSQYAATLSLPRFLVLPRPKRRIIILRQVGRAPAVFLGVNPRSVKNPTAAYQLMGTQKFILTIAGPCRPFFTKVTSKPRRPNFPNGRY